jgi:hypothetical protein
LEKRGFFLDEDKFVMDTGFDSFVALLLSRLEAFLNSRMGGRAFEGKMRIQIQCGAEAKTP